MNRKQLIFLLAVLVVTGSAGLVLLNRNKESWAVPEAKMGDKVLPNFQPNDVAAIHIKGRSDLNLAHKSDLWRVQERNEYPADFHKISDILIKLKGLKVVESETVEPSDLGRVNLDEPGNGSSSGTLIEFKDAQGKVIDALLLGKRHIHEADESSHSPIVGGKADGCYVLLPSDPKNVMLISDALGGLGPNPEQWLSKDFFKVEKMKSCALTSTNAANSWKISRESESSPWILADAKPGEVLDINQAFRIADSLISPRFVDITSTNVPAETGLDKPMVAAIETFDHFTYTIKIGAKSLEGHYYLTVAVTAEIPIQDTTKKLQEKLKQEQALAPWVYMVGSWIMDPLLLDRARILQGSKEDNAAEADKPATSAATNKASPAEHQWTPRVIQ